MNGTDFRVFYEQYGLFKLASYLKIQPSDIKHISKTKPTHPYDLYYRGTRVDVKYSHPVIVQKGKKAIWDFNLRKVKEGKRSGQQGDYCDHFLLIGMHNGIPKAVFFIPSKKAPTNHIRISISGDSKYNQYVI